MILVVTGCAPQSKMPKRETLEEKAENFARIAEDKTVRIVPDNYIGVNRIPMVSGNAPVLHTRITLRTRGSLHTVADRIMELVPLTVNIASDHDVKGSGDKKPDIKNPNPQEQTALEALLAAEALNSFNLPGDAPKRLNINYEGPLAGLLDQIALQSGYGWDFDRKRNAIVFARTMVRTFTLAAAPGKVSYKNQLTNRSKEASATGQNLGDSVNSMVQTGDTSSQTSQTYQSELSFDVWGDTVKTVEGMLSSIGKASANQAAGTISVRDRPENIRQISAYIEEVNTRYQRQVAMKINVYALEVADTRAAGIDLLAMFSNKDVVLSAGSLAATGTIGTASAAIVSGDLKGSEGILRALRQWGDAKQITSSGIVAMNNQPAPVEAVRRISYLAGSSTETTDYGQTTELTPGEVTTGFSMTVTPHILRNRRVILQYNVRLSALDSMETFKGGDVEIQLPQVSTRAFSQRASMLMGQTLVLAGFEQVTHNDDKSLGILSLGQNDSYTRVLLVITIEIENATPEIAMEDM